MYKPGKISDLVVERADRAFQAGADGVISSPLESTRIRNLVSSSGRLIVTPGVRPEGADLGDQKRIATPSVAINNGSNHIVVGRPIIRSSDPKAAAHNILTEINS
jgi:orotidine-5'-phosphate decarboxylase